MSTYDIDKHDELPQIDGPKLPCFKERRYKKIEYLELLNPPREEEQSSNGGHGYVFKVLIDSEPYALKIVCASNLAPVEGLTVHSFASSTLKRRARNSIRRKTAESLMKRLQARRIPSTRSVGRTDGSGRKD
jgi:hypothetical protein